MDHFPRSGIRTAARLLSLGFGLALAAGPPAAAQDQPEQGQQLETLQQQIDSSKANQARIAAEIAAAVKEQDTVAEKLVAISKAIKTQQSSIAASEKELKQLAEDRARLLVSLGEKQDMLSDLLAGLQRMEQNPPPALVVEPDDVLKALRGAMLMGTIVPELQGQAEELVAELDRQKQIEAQITTRKHDIESDMERLRAARADLNDLVKRKKDLVSKGNADLAIESQRIAQLGQKASSLKQLLTSLAEEKKKAEARAAAEEKERLRLEDLQRRPKVVFAEARGKLELPAQGQVMRRFGEADGLGGKAQGLMIATAHGAQVTTPADGKVEFAGPFRSYGQVIILNPGGGYRVLLAGMDKVTPNVGEYLRAGEPVGEMGSGPASVTLFGDVVQDGRPVLYIEFRNSTEAIDSGPWWIGGLKEARG